MLSSRGVIVRLIFISSRSGVLRLPNQHEHVLWLRIFTHTQTRILRYRLQAHNKSTRRQSSKISHLVNFFHLLASPLPPVVSLRPRILNYNIDEVHRMFFASTTHIIYYKTYKQVCKFFFFSIAPPPLPHPLRKLCSPSLGIFGRAAAVEIYARVAETIKVPVCMWNAVHICNR